MILNVVSIYNPKNNSDLAVMYWFYHWGHCKYPCWFISWGRRVIQAGFFPLPFRVEDNDVRSVQRPTNHGWNDAQKFWFSGIRAAMGYKALEELWVPSRHRPFMVHFDIVRIVISSYGWWGDDVLCLLELNELKSEVSFVCKWVGVHWTQPISCLIFMLHKWGIALPFCAKGLSRKP